MWINQDEQERGKGSTVGYRRKCWNKHCHGNRKITERDKQSVRWRSYRVEFLLWRLKPTRLFPGSERG